MKRTMPVYVAIVAVLLASVLYLAPGNPSPTQAQAGSASWSEVRNVSTAVNLLGVFMVDQNTAWVSGGDDYAYVAKIGWDGAAWKVLKDATPTGAIPGKLSVVSDNNIWATGGPTGIMHYDGTKWSSVPTPPLNAAYNTIQMFGNGEEGWAGGGIWPGQVNPNRWRPVILHYIHGHWEQDKTLTGETPVRSLHFTADGGWAVGDKEVWRYQNGTWSQEPAPSFCPGTGCIGGYMGSGRSAPMRPGLLAGALHATAANLRHTPPIARTAHGGRSCPNSISSARPPASFLQSF